MTRNHFRAVSFFAASVCMSAPAGAVDFSLFGDVIAQSGDREEDVSTFRLGKFDLFVNQELDDETRVNAELIFEDAGHGFETDIERFGVTRTVNESLNIAAGRFHTPLGFWNHNFHHGIIVQDTVTRPFFLEPDDAHEGVFPTHVVGLMANGTAERGDYTINYHFAIANGPSIDTTARDEHDEPPELQINNYQDGSDDKAFVARVGVAPTDGNWGVGLSAMNNTITESGEKLADPASSPYLDKGEVLFKQQIVALDARYTTEKYYAIAEYFTIRMTDGENFNPSRTDVTASSDQYTGTAQYLQLGYTVNDEVGVAVRLEELKFDEGAAFFETLGFVPETRTVYALRYKLSDSNVLRFQLTKAKTDDESFTRYSVQWFFMLF